MLQWLLKSSAGLVRFLVKEFVSPLGRCVACDILYFTLRDIRTFQLLGHAFSCKLWFVKFILGQRSFSSEFMVFFPIVWFQKISIPPPKRELEILNGGGGGGVKGPGNSRGSGVG